MSRPPSVPGGLPDPGLGTGAVPGFAHDNLQAIWWMLLSVVGASAMTLSVRLLAGEMDSRMIVAWRAGVTLAVLLPVLLAHPRWRAGLRFSRPMLHLWRGLAIAVSTQMGFYAIAHLPLVTATVLFFTAPIWATLMAMLFNSETVGLRRMSAVAVGFVGVLVVLRPGWLPLDPAMFAALGSSILFAVALTLSRRVAEADGALTAYVSSVGVTVLVAVPLALPVLAMPAGQAGWLGVLALVATGALRGVADIQAYRKGEASILAPFAYLRLVLIGLGGYLLFAEIPDRYALAGAVIIIGAALYIAHREAVRRRAAKSSEG